MSILQLIIIILIIFVIFGVGVAVFFGRQNARKKHVMSMIKGQDATVVSLKIDKSDDPNKRRSDMAKKLKDRKVEEGADTGAKKVTLSLKIEQAGLSVSTKKFWLFSMLSMVIFVTAGKAMGMSPVALIMLAIIGVFGLPRLVLKRKAAKRQKKFLEEFPDALEATVRLLKAGMPVSEAILMISREFTGPVGEEMSRIYDQQKIGIPMHEAALEATRRMPLPEMQMFATGLAIQAQTGASLSEVLTNLAGVIRARFRLKRKIKALSSEAIASASIIGALPNFVAISLYFVNREYIELLFYDPFGKVLLAGAIIWMCIGIFVMKIMINFKV